MFESDRRGTGGSRALDSTRNTYRNNFRWEVENHIRVDRTMRNSLWTPDSCGQVRTPYDVRVLSCKDHVDATMTLVRFTSDHAL
jgi:hypothetical protein